MALRSSLPLTCLIACLLALPIPGSSSAAVWYPRSTSVTDNTVDFELVGQSYAPKLGRIECNGSLAGKTPGPIYGTEELSATISIFGCAADGRFPINASGPTGPIAFIAKKPTWSSYYGATKGGGDVLIPTTTSYEFRFQMGTYVDCILKVNYKRVFSVYQTDGFYLEPNLSSLYSPMWGINRVTVPVSVSGSTASECNAGPWVLITRHLNTYPSLYILQY
jgi:hypothetical protein